MRTFGLLSHSRFFSCLLASLSADKKLFFCIFRFFEIRLVSPSKRNSLYFISALIKRVPCLLPSLHSSPEKEVIHSAGSFQYHFQRQLPAASSKTVGTLHTNAAPARTYRNILITPPATVAATGGAATAAVVAATTCAPFELSLITKKSEFFMPHCTFPASQLQSIYKYFPQLASTSTGWHRALTGLGSARSWFCSGVAASSCGCGSYLASTSRNMRVIL